MKFQSSCKKILAFLSAIALLGGNTYFSGKSCFSENMLHAGAEEITDETEDEISDSDEEDVEEETDNPREYEKTTEGFVTRMYNIVLEREPDSAGLNNWVEKLNNHSAKAADIVSGFFFSDEYKARAAEKTYDEQIADYYKAMLGRNPDSAGLKTWESRLEIGMTTQSIAAGFAGSNEFKALCESYGIIPGSVNFKYSRDKNYERTAFVYRLYKNCLGRTPDIPGIESWCKKLENGMTGTQIAEGFIFSSEYKKKNTSDEEYITMLYNTMLGRNPDESGFYSWLRQIWWYDKTRTYVANGFLFSNEFKGQCAKAGVKLGERIKDIGDPGTVRYIINTAPLKKHDIIPLYNVKEDNKFGGKHYFDYNVYVSETDKKIFDKFAKEHFNAGMTNYDKLIYTWEWMHYNVKYAKATEDYAEIAGLSFIEAIFEHKKGQCIQYNGAMAELMAYMGYDTYMIEMWLYGAGSGQHFGMGVIINGKYYSIEVGNEDSSGSWMWFLEPDQYFHGIK